MDSLEINFQDELNMREAVFLLPYTIIHYNISLAKICVYRKCLFLLPSPLEWETPILLLRNHEKHKLSLHPLQVLCQWFYWETLKLGSSVAPG